jgi:streptogramin lyase
MASIRWLSLLWVAVAVTAAVLGAELDKRLEAARQLEQSGQLDAARKLLEEVAATPAEPDAVPQALLALGRLAWPNDDPDAIGRSEPTAALIQDALTRFETVQAKYPKSPATPQALWRLALLQLEPGSTRFSVDQASATLTTLQVVFPDSAERVWGQALHAELQAQLGEWRRARGLAFELASSHSLAPRECARVWNLLGQIDLRERLPYEALNAFSRAVECGIDSVPARQARQAITRIARRPLAGTVEETALSLRSARLSSDRDGTSWATSAKDGVVAGLRGDRVVARHPMTGVVASSFDRWGRRWSVVGSRILAPTGAGEFPLPERARPIALIPVDARSAWVLDRDSESLYRVGVGGRRELAADLPAKAEPIDVELAPDGSLWVLDDRSTGSVHHLDAQGRLLQSVTLATLSLRVNDLAVDSLGVVYMLDTRARALVSFSEDGKIQDRWTFPDQGPSAIAEPEAVSVDPSGAIAMFDGKRGKVVWLR